MAHILSELSSQLAGAVDRAATSVVQVYGHRRPAAGIVFAPDLVAAPSRALGDDAAVVRLPGGDTLEGQVLGHAMGMGLGIVRVNGLNITPPETADEPRVGSLAIAIGRTWSGAVMASVTNVAVVGGPLRTSRASQLDRVIRIAQPPHGALSGGALVDVEGRLLGIITGSAIRGTTIVVPATLAFEAAHQIAKKGGTRQGYLGIGTTTAVLSPRQREDNAKELGLLITSIADGGPADTAGLLVGDVILRFAGEPTEDPETLVTLLRGDHVGKPVTLAVLRGVKRQDVSVVVGERPSRRG